MYERPVLADEEPTTFGVSGKLWRSALVMYDRQTRSLWSQVNGTAMVGGSEGTKLAELPSTLTTWGEWRHRHPDTLVLVKTAARAVGVSVVPRAGLGRSTVVPHP